MYLMSLQILREKYSHKATQHSLVKLDLSASCQIGMMETTYRHRSNTGNKLVSAIVPCSTAVIFAK
jgi:hypothetical protein